MRVLGVRWVAMATLFPLKACRSDCFKCLLFLRVPHTENQHWPLRLKPAPALSAPKYEL